MVDELPVERKGGVFIKTDTGEKFSPAAGPFVSVRSQLSRSHEVLITSCFSTATYRIELPAAIWSRFSHSGISRCGFLRSEEMFRIFVYELSWCEHPPKQDTKNRQGSKECGTEHKSVHHFGWRDMKRGDSAGLAAFRQLFSDVLGGRLVVLRLVMEMRKLIMINNSCKDGSSLPPVRLGSSRCDLPFREKEQKVSMQLEAAYQNKTGSGHFSLLYLPQESRCLFSPRYTHS